MRVDKVILRAALSTLAAIVILFGFMIFALCYIYPSTMMNIAYDLGMDGASITCAKRSYKRSDEVYYIAFATEVAILSEDYEEIAKCGALFAEDDEFATYCKTRNGELGSDVQGTYEQYVYGQICVAEYQIGEKAEAVNDAFAYVGNAFPQNNAVVAVLVTALGEHDLTTVESIKGKMEQLQNGIPEQDKAYFGDVLALAQNG